MQILDLIIYPEYYCFKRIESIELAPNSYTDTKMKHPTEGTACRAPTVWIPPWYWVNVGLEWYKRV